MANARVRPTSAFRDHIARAGFSYARLAHESGVASSTIRAILAPHQHPWRRGPLYRTTAWKIARAYAQATATGEEQAFALLFEEIEVNPKQIPAYAVA